MHKSSILSCFALSLAKVSIVQTANGPKTIGCGEYIDVCDNNLTRNRCCNGGDCRLNTYLNSRPLCFPKEPREPIECGETFAQCDTDVLSDGCCSDLDECNCSLNDTAICVCMPKPLCIQPNAACTTDGFSCCESSMTCQCTGDPADCKCLTKPQPPCLPEGRPCGEPNRVCCGDFKCLCDRAGVNCKCGIPPTPPKPKCHKRDAYCKKDRNRCGCADHCVEGDTPRRYQCKRRPLFTSPLGCTPDNCVV